MKELTRLIMADAALAASLAALEDDDAFIAAAGSTARAFSIAPPEPLLRDAGRPDRLGLARWSNVAPFAGSALPPRDWLPIAVLPAPNATYIDWARFGPEPLRAPFYEDDIRRALRRPFNRAFRYRTGLHDLIAQAETMDSLVPSGFIFHMSRCGSTLTAQMLAALADSIAIAEAAPIDAVVQLARGLPEDDAARTLRAMISAFGRKRSGHERRYVVKLDCWHTLALPLFRRAFPDVPWVFLYRNPVEVLVSQMRQRGMQTVPEYLPPNFYGIAADETVPEEEYCARVLAAICRAILEHRQMSGGLVVNYRDLPDAVGAAILPHFGISCDAAELTSMRQTAQWDAKSPMLPFTADADAKRRAVTDAIRRAADRRLGGIYDQLEVWRAELTAPAGSPGFV